MENQLVREGDNAKFICLVTGGEKVNFTWRSDLQHTSNTCNTSYCTINGVTRRDNHKKITCEAEPVNDVNSTTTATLTVYCKYHGRAARKYLR